MSVRKDREEIRIQRGLNELVSALRQGLADSLVAVVLFGSRARGEAGEGSDWDLLVIARNLPPSAFQRHLKLKALLPVEWRGQTALVARTPTEFEAHVTSLMLDIALDGIVLYDSDRYAADRLGRLKRLMTNRGLRRERIGRDFVWRWKQFPGFNWSLEWEDAR